MIVFTQRDESFARLRNFSIEVLWFYKNSHLL